MVSRSGDNSTNSSGVEVGRSHKMTNQFQNFDGTTVTSQDVHYQAADGTFLGNEFSNNDSSGFRIEKLVSVTEEPRGLTLMMTVPMGSPQ